MSIKESFSSVDKSKNKTISLLPECFVSHHPSRKVIHLSSKQLSSHTMNISFDMTPIPKPKRTTLQQKNYTNNLETDSTLSKEKSTILTQIFEDMGIVKDSISGRNSNSTSDDIENISYFNLDDSDFED